MAPRRAHLGAFAAAVAVGTVDDKPFPGPEGFLVAGRNTGSAADAFTCDILQLTVFAPCFRIVAPCAPQVAALEKERRADAGAVVDRHALYGRDDSFHFRGLFYYCKYIG